MLGNLLMDMYKGLVELLGWVILCASAIAGLIIGLEYGYQWDAQILWAILGVAFGVVGGFIIDTLLLPPLLILFKIHERLCEIEAKG